MKDFLETCMKDLESLTGIRQLYYLQSDLEDGKRKFEVLIKGMVYACDKFPYIPDDRKKEIIASQMIEDQEYEHLDSRIITKWLNAFKSPYLNPAQLQDKEVVFEDISPETQKLVADWQASLLDFGGTKKDVTEAIKQIEKEDKARYEKPVSYSKEYRPRSVDEREEKIRQYIIKTKGKDWMGSRNFEMDGLKFRCDSEEDGYNIFVEALRD